MAFLLRFSELGEAVTSPDVTSLGLRPKGTHVAVRVCAGVAERFDNRPFISSPEGLDIELTDAEPHN
jgi:hypothetical protein